MIPALEKCLAAAERKEPTRVPFARAVFDKYLSNTEADGPHHRLHHFGSEAAKSGFMLLWRRCARTIEPRGIAVLSAAALLLGAMSGGCDRPAVGAGSGSERAVTGTAMVSAARAIGSLPVTDGPGSARPSAMALPSLPPINPEPTLHHGIPWYRDAPAAALSQAQREKK